MWGAEIGENQFITSAQVPWKGQHRGPPHVSRLPSCWWGSDGGTLVEKSVVVRAILRKRETWD